MFSTFPNFTHLNISDQAEYNKLIADYPPLSDISFTTLHIWWNLHNELSIATLSGNLVIDYNLPFDKENSGLCLVGKNAIDSTIVQILNHLKESAQPERLVHVPEFVINEIDNSEKFTIEEEVDYNEYILDSKELSTLESSIHGRTRRKVSRFLREVATKQVVLKELGVSSPEEKSHILECISGWENTQPTRNDRAQTEQAAIKKTLDHASELGINVLGLFLDDELCAVVLYHITHDQQYYILHHLKVNYGIPFIFDYVTQQVAIHATNRNVPYLNMEMDLGIEGLRRHKMGLRPIAFLRKYTIQLRDS